jgi:hypothetical protein
MRVGRRRNSFEAEVEAEEAEREVDVDVVPNKNGAVETTRLRKVRFRLLSPWERVLVTCVCPWHQWLWSDLFGPSLLDFTTSPCNKGSPTSSLKWLARVSKVYRIIFPNCRSVLI